MGSTASLRRSASRALASVSRCWTLWRSSDISNPKLMVKCGVQGRRYALVP
jgi:hypothetical protein